MEIFNYDKQPAASIEIIKRARILFVLSFMLAALAILVTPLFLLFSLTVLFVVFQMTMFAKRTEYELHFTVYQERLVIVQSIQSSSVRDAETASIALDDIVACSFTNRKCTEFRIRFNPSSESEKLSYLNDEPAPNNYDNYITMKIEPRSELQGWLLFDAYLLPVRTNRRMIKKKYRSPEKYYKNI